LAARHSSGSGDRIVSVRWVPDEEGSAELVVEVEDGDHDGRAHLRLVGWRVTSAVR